MKEIDKPVLKQNEILVRVYASSVNYGDITTRKFNQLSLNEFNMPMLLWLAARIMFGFNKPKKQIPGSEFAGEVEAVGIGVAKFKPGDKVFGYRGQNMGCNAEYINIPETSLVIHKPDNLTYEEVCAIPYGGITALDLLEFSRKK